MIVKTTFEGKSMRKYYIASLILKLILFAILIFNVIIPFGSQFLLILQESLNSGIWDLIALVKPIGLILLCFIGLVVVEAVVVFLIIIPLAGREINNSSLW